jgi:hypothetical protein
MERVPDERQCARGSAFFELFRRRASVLARFDATPNAPTRKQCVICEHGNVTTENQPGTSTRPHLTACLQTANPYELPAYVERSIHITHQLYCLSPRRHGPPSPTGVAAAGRRAHMRLLSSVQSPLLTTPAARAMIEQEPPALDMVSRRCVLCRIPSQFALPASPTAANRSACSLRVPCCPSRGASWP